MSAYSRMMLHFLHAAANARGAGWAPVHAFTFGTRLTNVTRQLRQRDADAALAAAGREAQDWEGGTRIGARCTPSTATGRGGCWGRGRWCS